MTLMIPRLRAQRTSSPTGCSIPVLNRTWEIDSTLVRGVTLACEGAVDDTAPLGEQFPATASADVLVGGGEDLIAPLEGDAAGGDIHRLSGVAQHRDAPWPGAEEALELVLESGNVDRFLADHPLEGAHVLDGGLQHRQRTGAHRPGVEVDPVDHELVGNPFPGRFIVGCRCARDRPLATHRQGGAGEAAKCRHRRGEGQQVAPGERHPP
jgi:hypothetical protein